ncbi:MAG TPA: hypothetical protein VN581_08435 [Patescibacteria group bacterium]|nr:hypothetical protein [Patescibacteria group bacterium]
MEFNFDIDVSPKPRFDPNATMFATVPGQVADLGNGECIFRPRHDDVPHVMTHQVLTALDRCREFRSADEHIDAIRQATPGAPIDGVRRVFNGLVERGLIVAAEDFAVRYTDAAARAAPQAEVGGLYIRACDRPAQLERLLESLQQHARQGHAVQALTVVDDSRAPEAVALQSRLLREHAGRAGAPVRHVDAATWQRVHDTLADALPAHRPALDDLIGRSRDGLPRTGPGRGWNLSLLLGAGKRILFGDDDFVLPLKLHPELQDGVELDAHEMSSVRFYTDANAAIAAGHDGDFDLLQWHLDLCGAPIGRVFDHAAHLVPTREQWRRTAPSRLPRLQPDARIVATMNGHRGDSGSASSDWMYALDPASSRDLYHDRNRYLRLIASGKVWMGPDRATTMVSTPFTPFAQDLSRLPAFVAPDERGEDGTFGAITRILDPTSWILHLPTSIGHLRNAEHKLAAPGSGPVARNFNYFLVDFLARCEDDLFAASPQARLAASAMRLDDLAAASDRELLRMLSEYLQATYSGHIRHLQSVASAAGPNAPVYWSADLQAVVKANAKAMLYDGPPRLAGWPAELDASACALRLRRDLTRFAAMMRAWPDLWQVARDLGRSGRLA